MPEKTTDKNKYGRQIDDEVECETEGDGSDNSSELDSEAIHAKNNSGHSFSSIAKCYSKFVEDDKDTEDLGEAEENPAETSTLPH